MNKRNENRETRACISRRADGESCRAKPGKESEYCFLHDPEQVEAAQAARRAGGQRLRKEAVLKEMYQLLGLDSVAGLRRLLEIAALDALALEDASDRCRQLAYIVQTGTGLHKVDTDERLTAVEAVHAERDGLKLMTKKLRRVK